MMAIDMKELYAAKDYEAICSAGDELEAAGQLAELSQYDFGCYMRSLYKLQRYDDCLSAYKLFHKAYPESGYVDDTMGWALYQTHLKDEESFRQDRDRYLRQVEFIIRHNSGTQYSPLKCVVLKAVKLLMEEQEKKNGKAARRDYELVNSYLDALDPAGLSTEQRKSEGDGRSRRMMSDREKWYNYKSKALLGLEEYEACISCCAAALDSITRFTNQQDMWLKYRQAKSYLQMGEPDSAAQALEDLLQGRVGNWNIYGLAYDIARQKGDADQTIYYASEAALVDGSHEMRVKMYAGLVPLLVEHHEERAAMLHQQLVDRLYAEKGWPAYRWKVAWSVPADIAAMDKKSILRELKPFWKKMRDKNKVFTTGRVKRILPSGRDGFITSDDGHDYYFRFDDIEGRRAAVKEGSKVRFTLGQHENRKKHVCESNAVEITLVG